jgi:hypothetical protein
MPAPRTYVTDIGTKIKSATVVARELRSFVRDPGMVALTGKLTAESYKPVPHGPNAYAGWTNSYKSSDGKTATFELTLQSYKKPGSKDAAAVGVVSVKSGRNSLAYRFVLVAPGGDFEKAVEFKVGRANKVVMANSWWSCWKSCLRNRCSSACLGALATCSGSWAAYFWCVVARCGGCVLGCSACCGCDCSWWCRWAVRCCNA